MDHIILVFITKRFIVYWYDCNYKKHLVHSSNVIYSSGTKPFFIIFGGVCLTPSPSPAHRTVRLPCAAFRRKSLRHSRCSTKMGTGSSRQPSYATSWLTWERSSRTRRWTRWSARRISTAMAKSTTRNSLRWWCRSKTPIITRVLIWRRSGVRQGGGCVGCVPPVGREALGGFWVGRGRGTESEQGDQNSDWF